MRGLRRLTLVLLLTSPLCLTGCKQGVGDRCQVQSDCDDNLICVLPVGADAQTGGTCQPNGAADIGVPSDGGTPDLSGRDLAVKPPVDAATAD